ncbi:DJ-1 family glyoxalase III [Intestinibacillus sp. Marseille-P6563]|uniref:DJ-1 family glyoxalase III n=1 Tax=Intestinibacillus sp. Marseille-P6563 TaxID=2364792 RepID=UPI000F05C69F|nr:DJ-1 family glyoxalase III [Intestinibacillus sp. Marseille-P6563]
MVYVFLADGFEEVEALTPVDLLRRAGAEVKTVGITGKTVTGARGVPVVADILPEEVDRDEMDMIVLPGGMPGTMNLNESEFVRDTVQFCADHDRYIGAICAAPSVILGGMDLLHHRRAICYPGMEDGMTCANVVHQNCCVDGRIITGRAAGAAFDFALALCTAVMGKAAAKQVAESVCYDTAAE